MGPQPKWWNWWMDISEVIKMKTYKVTILDSSPDGVIVEANSSDEAIDIIKNQINMLEISGDVEVIEQ